MYSYILANRKQYKSARLYKNVLGKSQSQESGQAQDEDMYREEWKDGELNSIDFCHFI